MDLDFQLFVTIKYIVPMSNISAYDYCSVSACMLKLYIIIGEEICQFYTYENHSILHRLLDNRYGEW